MEWLELEMKGLGALAPVGWQGSTPTIRFQKTTYRKYLKLREMSQSI